MSSDEYKVDTIDDYNHILWPLFEKMLPLEDAEFDDFLNYMIISIKWRAVKTNWSRLIKGHNKELVDSFVHLAVRRANLVPEQWMGFFAMNLLVL